MPVGDVLKFAKSLIFGSACDLNMLGISGNRPLVRVLSNRKGSHFFIKALRVMDFSAFYRVVCQELCRKKICRTVRLNTLLGEKDGRVIREKVV